jgi:transcriptional regulator with XRE-family HTH domain
MRKQLRAKREWSQPELAKRAKVSQAYLALGVPVGELLE